MLTDRDFDALVSVVRYFTLTRAQISRLHFPTDKRRDALRKAFAEHPGGNLYKFAARPELTPENLFRGPVWRNGAGEVVALLKGGDA